MRPFRWGAVAGIPRSWCICERQRRWWRSVLWRHTKVWRPEVEDDGHRALARNARLAGSDGHRSEAGRSVREGVEGGDQLRGVPGRCARRRSRRPAAAIPEDAAATGPFAVCEEQLEGEEFSLDISLYRTNSAPKNLKRRQRSLRDGGLR